MQDNTNPGTATRELRISKNMNILEERTYHAEYTADLLYKTLSPILPSNKVAMESKAPIEQIEKEDGNGDSPFMIHIDNICLRLENIVNLLDHIIAGISQ